MYFAELFKEEISLNKSTIAIVINKVYVYLWDMTFKKNLTNWTISRPSGWLL